VNFIYVFKKLKHNTNKEFYHALTIDKDVCVGCANCMSVCPTEAIRIRNGKAELYNNKCIDCGACYKVCPVKAIYIKQDDFKNIQNYKYRIALVPAILIGQFSHNIRTSQIYAAIKELGFTHVYEVENAAATIVEAYKKYMKKHKLQKPFISPFCPAVVRLIQVRFPSLVKNIIHFGVPLDFAANSIRKRLSNAGIKNEDIGMFYITPCAAKIASVKSPVEDVISPINGVINMDLIYNKIQSLITKSMPPVQSLNHALRGKDVLFSLTAGEKSRFEGRSFAIDGMKNIIEFLEQLENQEKTNVDFLELRACNQSCAGGVLTVANRFLAIERLNDRCKAIDKKNAERGMPDKEAESEIDKHLFLKLTLPEIKPRPILPIDNNITNALARLKLMEDIIKTLPGVHCCMCGAPTCSALAEDIVRGNAEISDCVFYDDEPENIKKKLNRIWGNNKFFKID
jgi:iron only hydrogenase large subunit-like protein